MNIRLFTLGTVIFCCGWLVASPPTLQWVDLPALPDPHGFGGPFVGVHNSALIVAGGANFPQGPPWGPAPGKKVWYDDIFVLSAWDATWQQAGRLPKRLAYGICLTTPTGLLLIGGEEDGAAVDDVWRLQWDPERRQTTVTQLPSLPKKSSYVAGALLGSRVFVAASHQSASADRLDTKEFWTLDLSRPDDQAEWTSLPAWPGAPRHKALGVGHNSPDGKPCFYLISGCNPHFDAEGAADLARFEFFTDAFRFDSTKEKWHRIADLPPIPATQVSSEPDQWEHQPRAAAAACGIGVRDSHLFVFSGATGRYLTRQVQDRPLFPSEVLAYHIPTDSWSVVANMPQGVVTTGVTEWNNHLVIPSGETRPGVRTPKVQAANVQW